MAFITEEKSVKRILNHIGEQTKRAPPLELDITTNSSQEPWFADYMPTVEEYIHDPECVN